MTCENVVLIAMDPEERHYAYYVVHKIKMTHKKVSQNTSVSHDYSVFLYVIYVYTPVYIR